MTSSRKTHLNHLIILCLLFSKSGLALEQEIHGLLELRYTITDGIDSYLTGDYGKFQFPDGNRFSLSQATINYQLHWQDKFSLHLIASGFANGVKNNLGFTESYFQYKQLPSDAGYRFTLRGGLMYPKVSMTNKLSGWASPYTLSYSTLNAWLGEELRHRGVDFTLTRLGRFSDSEHDFELTVTGFQGNDPAGAVLAWHGWAMSSRQTLPYETQALPNSHIGFVPENSDMFLELDHRIGFQISSQWTWHRHGRILLGYYDNQADPKVVKNIQWAWRTKFSHLGIKWQLAQGVELISQYLRGNTLMQTTSGSADLVNNDYDSGFVMLSKKMNRHRLSTRLEAFSVSDKDSLTFDDNNEHGKAFTLNYSYRLHKQVFLQTEFNWLDSHRPSRAGKGHNENLIERQLQFAARYFF
ncbi:hypothetical protein [Thalassomonas sp. RHCl1]|uniref:hypothetical protein n=1 Tax=Thalassomonas sp. RHCl1 TaxID=2995320 RepID=UPI00248BB5CA|nr:hypothetical protein [Thalassomonas sp. RHCl1]